MQFKLFGFSFCIYNGGFWFRDRDGNGLSIVDRAKHQRPFSFRNGFVKFVSYREWDISELRGEESGDNTQSNLAGDRLDEVNS